VLRHIEHPDWHQPFMVFGQDASLLLLGQGGTYDEAGILEIWRVDDGNLLYTSADSGESARPWTHLAGAAVAPDESIMLSCYGELAPNALQEEFGGGVLWADGKGLCAVYVWQAQWSHLLEEAQRQSNRRREVPSRTKRHIDGVL
jgi:hypothetical protein